MSVWGVHVLRIVIRTPCTVLYTYSVRLIYVFSTCSFVYTCSIHYIFFYTLYARSYNLYVFRICFVLYECSIHYVYFSTRSMRVLIIFSYLVYAQLFLYIFELGHAFNMCSFSLGIKSLTFSIFFITALQPFLTISLSYKILMA